MHARAGLTNNQRRKLRQTIEILAGANRCVSGARHALHGLDIFRGRRVFHPDRIHMLDGIAVFDNVVDRIFPVALDCHIDVGTNDASMMEKSAMPMPH